MVRSTSVMAAALIAAFGLAVRVFRGGKLVTTCRLKPVGWRASPA